MANLNESLAKLLEVDGALCAALVDANSGMLLGKAGTGMDLDLAAAGNTEVVRAKMKTMKSLGLNDAIEDILITLGKQYHIIRPIISKPGLFFLSRARQEPGQSRSRASLGARFGTRSSALSFVWPTSQAIAQCMLAVA